MHRNLEIWKSCIFINIIYYEMNNIPILMRNWPVWHLICDRMLTMRLLNVVIECYARHVRYHLNREPISFDSDCTVYHIMDFSFHRIFEQHIFLKNLVFWWIIRWDNGNWRFCPQVLRFVSNSAWQFLFSLGLGMS